MQKDSLHPQKCYNEWPCKIQEEVLSMKNVGGLSMWHWGLVLYLYGSASMVRLLWLVNAMQLKQTIMAIFSWECSFRVTCRKSCHKISEPTVSSTIFLHLYRCTRFLKHFRLLLSSCLAYWMLIYAKINQKKQIGQIYRICFCLLLHKLASNMPGKN